MIDGIGRLAGLGKWVRLALLVGVVTGCGSSVSANSGSGNSGSGTGTQIGTGAAASVYVAQQPTSGSGSVLQFAASANGNASPLSTLTTAGLVVSSVFTDTKGQVYAGGVPALPVAQVSGEIQVFAAGASNGSAPVRTLTSGPTNSFSTPTSLCVDSGGLMYVTGQNGSVSVFSSTATGATAPFRFIQGSLTQITSANGVAVDGLGNIYVANGDAVSGSVLVFGPTASGNVAPVRVITATSAVPLIGMPAITVDFAGNVYVVSNTAGAAPSTIVVYAQTASGAVAPLKTIGGSLTGLGNAVGVNVDGAGNLYVLNETSAGGTTTASVLIFGPAQTGNVQPMRQFTSASWTSPSGSGIGLL